VRTRYGLDAKFLEPLKQIGALLHTAIARP
jgi:hypothetical protein